MTRFAGSLGFFSSLRSLVTMPTWRLTEPGLPICSLVAIHSVPAAGRHRLRASISALCSSLFVRFKSPQQGNLRGELGGFPCSRDFPLRQRPLMAPALRRSSHPESPAEITAKNKKVLVGRPAFIVIAKWFKDPAWCSEHAAGRSASVHPCHPPTACRSPAVGVPRPATLTAYPRMNTHTAPTSSLRQSRINNRKS